GAMALALMLPRLFDLRDSRMLWPWFVLWIGILAETVGYILNIARPVVWLDILVAGLWATSWLIHLATLRQITPAELHWTHEPAMSEEQRLVRAFQLCYAGCYRVLRTVYGERRTRAFDDRMDVVAATAGWDVSLDRDHARVGSEVRRLDLYEQGSRFAEVLRYTVQQIEEITGEVFARRAIQAAYDALPWPERETAGRLCFPDTPWARDLSASFGGTRNQRLRLLRQLDLLIRCDDDELDVLAHAIDEQHVERGTTVLKPDQFVTGLWIVEAGEIVRRDGAQIVGELHRGDVFGDAELREGRPSTHRYSATMASTLLFVPASAFAQIEQSQAARVGDSPQVDAVFRQLERVELFDKLPRSELRSMARLARRQTVPARSLLIRQGQPQHAFFLIERGQAVLLYHQHDAAGTTSSSQILERLGPGQYAGEVELLHGGAPTASLVTATETVVLVIPQAAIRNLLRNEPALARTLAQIDSGRRLQARPVPVS
ncbi:MAG TPA: cyclic nucleotide-binding domain-containing protein, partial [Roseiflexaceae bacterium]|nr:cyclic nucleotide-binding domain-containing protein [Roseiflexaceae bacterium]